MGDKDACTIKMTNNADDSDGENRARELGVRGEEGCVGSAQVVEGKGGLSLGELLGARCHCPSSPEKDFLSSDCEGIACAPWFDPREVHGIDHGFTL